MKRSIAFILACFFLFILSGCDQGRNDSLVGIWQTEGFVEELGSEVAGWQSFPVAMYLTEDNNMYIFFPRQDEYEGLHVLLIHYGYEVSDGELLVTQTAIYYPEVGFGGAWADMHRKYIQIRYEDDNIHLHITNRGEVHEVILYRVAEDIPFGWTNIQREEIAENREWIEKEILAHAERFDEMIGSSYLLRPRSSWSGLYIHWIDDLYAIEFRIYREDGTTANIQSVSIAFADIPHERVQLHFNIESRLWYRNDWPNRIGTERFVLYYFDSMPDEWREIFYTLDNN